MKPSWTRPVRSGLQRPIKKPLTATNGSSKASAYFQKLALKKSQFSWSIAAYIGSIGLIIFFTTLFGVYLVFLSDLPPIEQLEKSVAPQSSVMYDKEGKELYRFYDKENRTYVSFSGISQNMRDAMISAEDKTFFENQGFDLRGMVRSIVYYVTGKTDKIQGTSTISQQLIKISFLSNERSLDRKLKEAYLSVRLNGAYSKEKILEFYLNKISFGNNTYGIEEAAKAYFGKTASELGVLGSSILASLPKGPSYYSPYSHKDRLLGYFFVYPKDKPNEKISLESQQNKNAFSPLLTRFYDTFGKMTFEKKGDKVEICGLNKETLKKSYSLNDKGCTTIGSEGGMDFLNSIRIQLPSGISQNVTTEGGDEVDVADYSLEYNTGRKDFVLSRMLEDAKIDGKQFKEAVEGGFHFTFKKSVASIKYPHFVFYVKEYLEAKYGKDFESQGGLKIYTTIDSKLQDKAQEVIQKQYKTNLGLGVGNEALVSVDNKTGHILAMVGGVDYFDEKDGSNVNMITSRRQPGSSFKPIEYALAMSKHPIGPETPIYDVKTSFGEWSPANYDGKFYGRMTIKTALGNSRNIPAIKVFLYAGGEDKIVEFANALGIKSLIQHGQYGTPLAIGTGEIKPLELAGAYSVFANGGVKKNITPILRIADKKGNIIEDNTSGDKGVSVFSEAASWLISSVLSDSSSRPTSYWNGMLTLNGRPAAAKTGTSNKDVSKGKEKKILPSDLWTAGYTPQITTVVWAGNTDGTPTKGTADGLNCAAPIWRDFMNYAHRNLKVEKFVKPDSVISATISKMTGRKAGSKTPNNMRVTTNFAVAPTEYEASAKEVQVDSLCNGKVTENTPKAAIKTGYLMNVNPIIESYNKTWLKGIKAWTGEDSSTSDNIFFSMSDEACDRPGEGDSSVNLTMNVAEGAQLNLGSNIIEIVFKAQNPIQKLQILRDGEIYRELVTGGKTEGRYANDAFKLDATWKGKHTFGVKAIDKYGYSKEISASIITGGSESNIDAGGNEGSVTQILPTISLINPKEGGTISIYQDQFFNLRFSVDGGNVRSLNVFVDGNLVKSYGSVKGEQAYSVNEEKNMTVGEHRAVIECSDDDLNKASKEVKFSILPR